MSAYWQLAGLLQVYAGVGWYGRGDSNGVEAAMKPWRPDDWENHFTKEHGNLSPDADTETSIYEAGADAMLEALRANGEHIQPTNLPIPLQIGEPGTLCFIPDVKNDHP